MSQTNLDIPQKAIILFDSQIKYIEVEAHPNYRRVKVYIREVEQPLHIDFTAEQSDLYDLFLKSLYNK